MIYSTPRRHTCLYYVLIGSKALFAATLLAVAFAAPPSGATPHQVAVTLDSIVQPRFQQNAGRFGSDRIFTLDGHGNVQWVNSGVDGDWPSEKRRFAAVKSSHRPYIIAILHVRHKPGAHVDPATRPQSVDFVKPTIDCLTTVGATQGGAHRMYVWANNSLGAVVLPHVAALNHGQPVEAIYENWVVVMRPVRALRQSCVNCHVGVRRGDTLRIMVYAVDKNQKIQGSSFVAPSEDE